MWLEAVVRPPAPSARSGRTSCFWASVVRCDLDLAATASAARAPSRRLGRRRSPTTEAGSITARSLGAERVEPRGEQRLDRRRAGRAPDEVARSTRHVLVELEELLVDEHRDAAARRRAGCPRLRRRSGPASRVEHGTAAEQALDHRLLRSSSPSGVERRRASRAASSPVGPLLEQLGPGRAQEEQRRAVDGSDEVLDQVEQRRLGPVDVVDDERPAAARRRGVSSSFRTPQNSSSTGNGSVGQADRGCEPRVDVRVLAGASARELRRARRRGASSSTMPAASRTISASGQNVMPSPVGEAAAAESGRARVDAAKNSSASRDLPTPGVADERDQPAACAARPRRRTAPRARPAPPRGRRAGAAGARAAVDARATPTQPIGGDALGLALQLERLDRLDLDAVPDEPVGQLAEQHLALGRRLLEPRGDVDGVAGDESLAGRRVAGDDLAGVDAGPVRRAARPSALRARR